MIAALISKIIGMLYKSPLSNTLGNNSMGLFNYAQNVYFILLMIASFSIPQAVSKIMAEKLAFKRYRDAQKVFHCALLYVIIMGGVVALFCLFGSSILVPESMSGARLALKMLAPTIFLSGILGTFRGYFQAYRNMLPTSLSQIVEQCFVAVFAILMSTVMLNNPKQLVLTAAHPSPLSASRGFFGCRHFSQTNEFLEKNGLAPIDWQIENIAKEQ